MTTAALPKRSKHRRPPAPSPQQLQASIDALWSTCLKLATEIGDLKRELQRRAHLAAGTHPRSPHYAPERRSWRGAMKYEAKRRTRRAVLAKAGLAHYDWNVRKFREVRRSRGAPAAVAMAVFRYPLSYLRFLFFILITLFLLLALVWWALAPVRSALGKIVPGVYPASDMCSPEQPAGGVQGAAWQAGNAVNSILDSEPNADAMVAGAHAVARGAGSAWESFRGGLEGALEQPTVTVDPNATVLVAGAGCGGPCLPGATQDAGAPVVPTTGPLTDEQVAQLALAVGWPAEEVASGRVGARVRAESTTPNGPNDPTARDYADGTHHGLLQLGTAEQKQYLAPGASAFDPRANLRAARLLWEARGWQPWTASNAGHQQYLDEAQAAAARVMNTPTNVQPVGAATTTVAATCTVPALLTGAPAVGDAIERDLAPRTAAARRVVMQAFPELETIYGWGTRPNKTEHDDLGPNGEKAANAVDYMINDIPNGMAVGDRITAFHLAHWQDLGVDYLIWNKRIWRSPTDVRPYSGRSDHSDHPHVTYLRDGVVSA